MYTCARVKEWKYARAYLLFSIVSTAATGLPIKSCQSSPAKKTYNDCSIERRKGVREGDLLQSRYSRFETLKENTSCALDLQPMILFTCVFACVHDVSTAITIRSLIIPYRGGQTSIDNGRNPRNPTNSLCNYFREKCTVQPSLQPKPVTKTPLMLGEAAATSRDPKPCRNVMLWVTYCCVSVGTSSATAGKTDTIRTKLKKLKKKSSRVSNWPPSAYVLSFRAKEPVNKQPLGRGRVSRW